MKMSTRLLLSFGLAVFFIVLVGGHGAIEMAHLANLTNKMYRHPLTVSNAVRDVEINIIRMQRHMKDVALSKNNAQLEKAIMLIDHYETIVYQQFDLIRERFLGDQEDVETLVKAFSAWKPIRDEVIALTRADNRDDAADIIKEKDAKHVQLLETKMKVLVDFASNKADEFMTNAEQQERTAYQWIYMLIIVVTIAMLGIGISAWRLINQSLKQSVGIADSIAGGNLNNQIDTSRKDEIGQLLQAFERMQAQLRDQVTETIHVLKQLGEGSMQIEIKGRFTGDFAALKEALESTATQLAEVKTKNEIEKWLKSGQAQLNEQVSGEQDIKQLAENIINFLTPYVDAKVGVFHLLEQNGSEEPYLKIIASHAYVRRADGSNMTKLGEGVVGQAAYERKIFTINRTPEKYLNVQSSLNNDTPNEILVIPFLYESSLKGVVELASLTPFTDTQLEFLKQVMPNIGIVINTAESRAQMQLLLKQSQGQTG